MRYTAGAIARALEGARVEIGGRVFHARPLSAPMLLAVRAHVQRHQTGEAAALLVVLRAAFPRRWWYRWWPWADPVRAVLRLPADIVVHVLRALVRVNIGSTDVDDIAADPVGAAIALHRRLVTGGRADGGSGGGVTLELAALHCELTLGAAWYYAPHRWPTADGYAPAAMVLVAWHGLQQWHALQRVERATAALVAQGGRDGQQRLREWMAHAYPTG